MTIDEEIISATLPEIILIYWFWFVKTPSVFTSVAKGAEILFKLNSPLILSPVFPCNCNCAVITKSLFNAARTRELEEETAGI